MNRKDMEQAILKYCEVYGYDKYDLDDLELMDYPELETMYYSILDELEEYENSDIED